MNKIELNTRIKAPIGLCFDLARSIELYISAQHANEEAVGGVTSRLIGQNEKVLWKVNHFGTTMMLETKITNFNAPYFFTYEQVNGVFKNMIHDHFFYDMGEETVMIDHFYFQTPYGFIGETIDALFLRRYLRNFLIKRNETIRAYAESEDWKDVVISSAHNPQSNAEKMLHRA